MNRKLLSFSSIRSFSYIIIELSLLFSLYIFIFDVYLVVNFGLHLFLFHLIARKLCGVSNVPFPILAVFCMPFEFN